MTEDEDLGELKGMIDFPCGCKARALIYEGSKGKFSVSCPICGRFTLFNSGQMSAVTVKPMCGASSRFKMKTKPPS